MRLTASLGIVGACLGLTLGVVRAVGADCGDGTTTAGEACDAGTAVCQPMAKNAGSECHTEADCGGPLLTGGTTIFLCGCGGGSCNDGVGNRDDVPGACRSTCMPPMCGDGVSDPGEQCDPGSSTSTSGPCLGNTPNTVCALGGFLLRSAAVTGNPNALIACTNDGQCAALAAGARCTGNPRCQLAECGDGFTCSDASCISGTSPLNSIPGGPGPEACDDGNTSSMDSCTPFGFLFTIGGTPQVPDQCQMNLCGDGATNMGAEQCDAGTSVCISGPKATNPPSKPCCTNDDCTVGSVTGVCSNAATTGNSNNPNSSCRCTCNVPFCGDGISDNALGEECDDGTMANPGPGGFCNKVQLCVGGENPGAICTSDADCTKGTCGPLVCLENVCGDGVVGGHEQCDDGNTVAANGSTDTCGVSTTAAGAVNQILRPGCDTTLTGPLANQPTACIPAECILPFCGDGVTNPGEMCDAGTGLCSANTFNPGAPCAKATDCKDLPAFAGTDQCGPGPFGPGNRDDVPDRCRSTCMPARCGDGTSDTNEQCDLGAQNGSDKPCKVNCTLATCGDGSVCSDPACSSGPPNPVTGISGPEQCDDGNATDPTATNLDVCGGTLVGSPDVAPCAAAQCGDGITNPGEQCDSFSAGCSNAKENLGPPEQPFDCCLDGNVVGGNKVGLAPGLLSVEQAFTALLGCRMPHLLSATACDRRLQIALERVANRIVAADVYHENNDISRARHMMRSAELRLNRLNARVVRSTRIGGPCAAKVSTIANQKANAASLTLGIATHLTEDGSAFSP